ncbi:hypothetical protein JQC92_21180 [Shewanella sp. 202IG2-18]|uniref:hypothetical protein n=1 Tax=Parashewanella hymeniacidonis TaxID=2807618 RepID=UPI0019616E0C|nr:hypothetical protein [Parashewanella hymeniacidonis]MBM7074499.1 hypothetical protein [Parashewanella hymeniacidonis]
MTNIFESYDAIKEYLNKMTPAAEQAGLKIKSWENIEENRLNILAQLPDSSDVLVFAYGSLMWNQLL